MSIRGVMTSVVGAVVMAWAYDASAQTEDWRHLKQDGDLDVAINIDSFAGSSTRREAQAVLAWLEGGPSGHMVLNVRIDCDARTISAVNVRIHDQQGQLLREGEVPPLTEPVKETDGTAALARAACEGAGLEGRSFESALAFATWAATQSER